MNKVLRRVINHLNLTGEFEKTRHPLHHSTQQIRLEISTLLLLLSSLFLVDILTPNHFEEKSIILGERRIKGLIIFLVRNMHRSDQVDGDIPLLVSSD